MIIELTEQLWDLLNPEFDGHTGLIGEEGISYTPEWYPMYDIRICPIITFIEKDIGRKYAKAFVVERKDEFPIICSIDKIDALEITEKNIFIIVDGKKEVVQGENVINLRDIRDRK